MTAWKRVFLWGLLVYIATTVLYPNPFGNNPDIIWDESYFLTSSLSAIQDHTLPGWDFPTSGTYYGGPQTYVDTAVLVPVVASVVASSHFSLTAAKVWVALNTGWLVHVLRIVNGVVALVAILFLFFYFKRRGVPRELGFMLALFLFLLLSNVLVLEFLHTAKMWVFYIVLVALSSALFMAQEYYSRHLNKPFIKKETYVVFLVWSAVLTFFQSYFGVFSIALLALYALLLRHIRVRDIWNHVRRYWYLIVFFALTQISFMYKALRISHALADASTRMADGLIDWWARLTKPLLYTIESQPLSMLYVVAVFTLIFFAVYKRSFFTDPRRRMYIMIAVAHPILTYMIFQVGLGFDILPRYAIILTIACSFSVAILMSELGSRAAMAALAVSGILFAVVSVHGIGLYWHPSSETLLLRTIQARYNSPENVFITDHSARRLTLPVNDASLQLLDQKRQDMTRFAFLLQHRDLLQTDTTFRPLTITAYTDDEMAAALARFATSTDSVWIVTRDCSDLCSAKETRAGTCFEINTNACGVEPQEVNALPVFLPATELGYSYVVRKVH